jgi:hypothetical protein
MALGVGLAIVIGLIRYSSVTVTGFFVPLSQAKVSRLEFSNGLTALVLSQIPGRVEGSHLFMDTGIFANLIVPIVMTTALFGEIAGPILYKDKLKPELMTEHIDEV